MAPADGVPVTSSLKDIYGDELEVSVSASRFRALTNKFTELYGEGPECVSRAPGRVNLVGEHIDYEGYSVLPMAILFDTLVAIKPSPGHHTLRLANMNDKKYPPKEFSADPEQEVDTANHHWGNYFVCAYKGVFDHLRKVAQGDEQHAHLQRLKAGTTVGLDVLVDGAVPPGAGLSSSAALVCSSVVAIMAALDLAFSREEIADLACRCERYIGTQSGGMDQAISILARPGVAKLIDFNPVRASDVVLPPGSSFVIANSLAVSEKAVTAATNYNRRVVECRMAALVLAVKLDVPAAEAISTVQTLSDVEAKCRGYAAKEEAGDSLNTASPLPAVKALLHEEPYTREEIEGILGTNLDTVFASSPTSLAVLAAATSYKLNQRATHVYSETRRVYEFRDVCTKSASSSTEEAVVEGTLKELGAIMDASHESCSKLYECSSPELEELVAVCRKGGAYGVRLTGAGWGGCTVALVAHDKAEAFVNYLKENFYASRVQEGRVKEADLKLHVFASPPSSGAAIFLVQG